MEKDIKEMSNEELESLGYQCFKALNQAQEIIRVNQQNIAIIEQELASRKEKVKEVKKK